MAMPEANGTRLPPVRKTLAALREEALVWVIRLRDADARDWQDFEQWMAADGRARDIYWDLAVTDTEVAEALAFPRPEARIGPHARRASHWRAWRTGGAFALAASILLLIFIWYPGEHYAVETRAGELRVVELGDGSKVLLNGSSKITFDRGELRTAHLEFGEARFSVAHDADTPFRVHAGEAELIDLGTVFSVTRAEDGLHIAVAEGAVRYRAGRVTRDLMAGDTLYIGRDGQPVAGSVDPADVAAWAGGRLVYDGASIASVAADLARATGLTVSVDGAAASRSFSGGFGLGERDSETVQRAARLMGLVAHPSGGGWILKASASDAQ